MSGLQRMVLKCHVPDELGIYILQIVPDAATARTAEHFLVSTRFKVLTLSLPDNKMEVVTVDSRSGQPISGAKVSFYLLTMKKPQLVKQLSPIPVESGCGMG